MHFCPGEHVDEPQGPPARSFPDGEPKLEDSGDESTLDAQAATVATIIARPIQRMPANKHEPCAFSRPRNHVLPGIVGIAP
jgi:hypothetical protein